MVPFALPPISIHTTILCPQCVCSLQWILIWIYSQCLQLLPLLTVLIMKSLFVLNAMDFQTSVDALTFALRSIVCLWFKSLWNARYLVLCVCLQCLQCNAPSHAMAASMQTWQCDDSPFFLCPFSRFVFLLRFALWLLSVCDFVFVPSPFIVYVPSSISLWWCWRLRRDGDRNWMSGSQWFHSLFIDVICCSIPSMQISYQLDLECLVPLQHAQCAAICLLFSEPLAYTLGDEYCGYKLVEYISESRLLSCCCCNAYDPFAICCVFLFLFSVFLLPQPIFVWMVNFQWNSSSVLLEMPSYQTKPM